MRAFVAQANFFAGCFIAYLNFNKLGAICGTENSHKISRTRFN